MTFVEKEFSGTLIGELPRTPSRKLMFKAPLYAWRLGLKYMLPPQFACITTRGRKSGLPRYTMVEHTELDGKFYIVSGWQDNPHWFKNLLADPQITIQPAHRQPVGGTTQPIHDDGTLRQVFEGMQTSPLWQPWLETLGIEPNVEDFLAKKDRVYILQITPDTTGDMILPPLEQDLRWITLLISGVLAVLFSAGVFNRQRTLHHHNPVVHA